MDSDKKLRFEDAAFRALLSIILIALLGVLLVSFLLTTTSNSKSIAQLLDVVTETYESDYNDYDVIDIIELDNNDSQFIENVKLPKQNELSISLENHNQLPPRNLDRYPTLASDPIIVVLYVHNRPHYLQVAVQSLSQVAGINETLLIVSHDGYFEEMNKIVEVIEFCQVKQIFAPYSPHVFADSFPGVSPNDCQGRTNRTKESCEGNTDQYGRYRSPKFASLKHHWWWMMNTVWDGLKETRQHSGHILFIEEDHYIFPNAYRNLQQLIALKPLKCPGCYAVNLAPSDVNSKGERRETLVAEKMGNVGYAFNRTVWRKIHSKAREFCFADDYNWDLTMWETVFPSFADPFYSLRGPRTSAVHFGKCGLHQGQGGVNACIDKGGVNIQVEEIDKVANIKSEWKLLLSMHQTTYRAGFNGRSGFWGDERDRELCLNFAKMYRNGGNSPPFLQS